VGVIIYMEGHGNAGMHLCMHKLIQTVPIPEALLLAEVPRFAKSRGLKPSQRPGPQTLLLRAPYQEQSVGLVEEHPSVNGDRLSLQPCCLIRNSQSLAIIAKDADLTLEQSEVAPRVNIDQAILCESSQDFVFDWA